jgi:hypothetical protein
MTIFSPRSRLIVKSGTDGPLYHRDGAASLQLGMKLFSTGSYTKERMGKGG